MRLLLIGPADSIIGGTTISFEVLLHSIKQIKGLQYSVIYTNKYKGLELINRIRSFIYVMKELLHSNKRGNLIILNASCKGILYIGFFLTILNLFYQKKIILRIFGGNFDIFYKSRTFLTAFILRYILNRANLILIQTKYLMNFLTEENIIRDTKRLKWYPTNRLFRPEKNMSKKAINFYYAGHIKKDKGIETIIRAAALLNDNIKIHLFGRIREDSLLNTIDNCDKCLYHGELNHDALIMAIRKLDALIYPSFHWGEGYPGIIVESILLGKPVLAAKWRSVPEIVRKNGLLFDVDDHKTLARLMNTLSGDVQLYEKLSREAYQMAGLFDSNKWGNTLVNEYLTEEEL